MYQRLQQHTVLELITMRAVSNHRSLYPSVTIRRKFYVENNQQNALNSIPIYFSFYDGFYMFRQNNAILGEQLCSFLSHFNVNMVGDKSWDADRTHVPARCIEKKGVSF
jgi:hypothetical protein